MIPRPGATHLFAAALTFLLPAAPVQDTARVYVYAERPSHARSWIPVSWDGAAAARLKRGKFFAIEAAPGRHVLSIQEGVPLAVELRSGEESFVRLDWNQQIGRPPIPVLTAVPAARARKEMMYLGYVDADRIASPSVPKSDPRAPRQPRLKRREQP